MISFAFICVAFFLEAWVEKLVIEMKNVYVDQYATINHREHFWSAVLAGWLMIGAAIPAIWIEGAPLMLLGIAVSRRIFFDIPLALFRKRPAAVYEGNDWWVRNVFRPVFGSRGRLKELAVEIAIVAFAIIKTLIDG